MTWLVRHVRRQCWVCNNETRQVISEEKADMTGVVMRYRICSVCQTRLHAWIADVLTEIKFLDNPGYSSNMEP